FAAEHGRSMTGVDPDAMSALTAYNFPGNVRELENVIERAVTLATESRLTAASLPDLSRGGEPAGLGGVPATLPEGFDLEREVEDFERRIILKALERTEGNRTEAARLLGVS